MKTRLLIVLLSVIPSIIYCQEEKSKENYIHSVDVGFGTGNLYESYQAINIGINNGLGKYFGNFIDYNLYLDKSNLYNYEVNFKLGPYFQWNKHSYLALSSGLSVIIEANGSNWQYVNGINTYHNSYYMTIPVQAKFNVDLVNGICMGLKGTYNLLIKDNGPNMGSMFLFLAYAW